MMTAHAARRLPGFRFEAQAPPLAEVLPRMDVAVFVGFAASGPIEIPIAVESAAQFTAIFGADAPLAWDTQRGTPVYAYLAPAVRAFFRNGGRRCWIVRVARRQRTSDNPGNRARTNFFPIPGLALARFDVEGKTVTRVTPAFARARSEGSWSDSLRVSSALLTRPVQVTGAVQENDKHDLVVNLALSSPNDVSTGDLLRLTFAKEGYVLMLAVKSVDPVLASIPRSNTAALSRNTVRVTAPQRLWFKVLTSNSLPQIETAVVAHVWTHEQVSSPPTQQDKQSEASPDLERCYDAVLHSAAVASPPEFAEPAVTLDLLHIAPADVPASGSIVCVDDTDKQLWITVQDVTVRGEVSKPDASVRITGQGMWLLHAPLSSLPTSTPTGEKLTYELWVRQGEEYAINLSDLAFAANHERFWGHLPTDARLYEEAQAGRPETPAIVWWQPASDVFRFPLAGDEDARAVSFPVTMQTLPQHFLGPVRLPGSALERDGLAEFSASLFLDEELLDAKTEDLLSQADFLRYLSTAPRPLSGIHAALGIEEASLLAVPDAVHRGWCRSQQESPPPALPSLPPLRLEWWHFLDCNPPLKVETLERAHEPRWGNFLDCGIRVIEPPVLTASDELTETGTFTLSWLTSPPQSSARYVLQEATTPQFSDAVPIYTGDETLLTLYGRGPGDYYYRVRIEVGSNTSDWSNGVAVRVAPVRRWHVNEEDGYASDTLLAVQRALLRLCAARGDVFAVLTLPEHYREDEAITHPALLKATPERTAPTARVTALGYGEAHALSYGAVYHPWLVGREETQSDELRRTPPCGAICGVFAARALTRGAWIAPANEPMQGMVALARSIVPARYLDLQEARINLIRHEARGFLVLDADTLSDDPDLRPINVRRLLSLLRRLALRLGPTYVFEPHDPSFRRAVKRGFEAMLEQMFVRGAFAGATLATSFQVVVSDALNTPQSVEQGRFIAELRVAPSLPMIFLTVRLVQTGDRGFVTEGQ